MPTVYQHKVIRQDRKIDMIVEKITAMQADDLLKTLIDWAERNGTMVGGSINLTDEEQECEDMKQRLIEMGKTDNPTQDEDDTTDCAHYHWVQADPYGCSSSGPGCLRSGGHCLGRCKFYTGYTGAWDGKAS